MWPVQIVVVSPVADNIPGMPVAVEQVLVEALIPETPVERFNEPILHWLARRDVVPFDAAILLPFEDGIRGEFCAVPG